MKRLPVLIAALALLVAVLLPVQAAGARKATAALDPASLTLSATAFTQTVFGGPVVSLVSTPAALGDGNYSRFWIDLPNHQTNHPDASFSCLQAGSPTGCQYMGPGGVSATSPYFGGAGLHTATVQVWRNGQQDPSPVFLGQASVPVLTP